MNKKTAVITFRTEEWIKKKLEIHAKINKWSVAQTVEELIKKSIATPNPERITVKTKDLIEMAKELEQEGCGGAEIIIDLKANEEEKYIYKELEIYGLECGGMGLISLDTTAKELTNEEIEQIP